MYVLLTIEQECFLNTKKILTPARMFPIFHLHYNLNIVFLFVIKYNLYIYISKVRHN